MASSILHFSCYSKNDKVKLAELDTEKSKETYKKVKSEIPDILTSTNPDTVQVGKYNLSYLSNNGILYLVVTKMEAGESVPERFLDQIVTALKSKIDLTQFPKVKELILQESLKETIDNVLNNFDTGLNKDQGLIHKIKDEVEQTKEELKENIKKTVENTEAFDELLVKSNQLKDEAKGYKDQSVELKNAASKRKKIVIISIIVGVVTLVIIYFVVAIVRCSSVNAFCKK